MTTRWISTKSLDNPKLPPATRVLAFRSMCGVRTEFSEWGEVECSRCSGHTGRHAEHDGEVIFAVWSD